MSSNLTAKSKPNSSAKQKSKLKPKRKPKAKPKDNLIVVFDPGTSLSKILYVINDGLVKWMTMGAEYFPLPSENAEFLPTNSDMGLPEDNAWVRIGKLEECHTIGLLASNQQATTSIKKSKKELLAYKIIAAVGAIAKREKLSPNFKLELGVLIPYDEFKHLKEDKDWSSNLKGALSNFYFQTQQLKVRLSDFQCMPEGYGIANYTSKQEDSSCFQTGNSAVIMLGYRNTSCLYFRRGTIDKTESGTTKLGFHTLLNKIIDKVPTLSKKDLIAAITTETRKLYRSGYYAYGYEDEGTEIDFASLSRSNNEEKALAVQHKLERAYKTSVIEYWRLLSDWLDETLPQVKEIDLMVFGGGSYQLLKSQLNEYADSWNAEYIETDASSRIKKYLLWEDAPHRERFLKENLGVRFADAWGFFVKFASYDLGLTLNFHSGEVDKNGN